MTTHPTYKELHRSRSDRMIGGVCGGLGQYFDVNPVFYRVGFVILALLGGAGLLLYGAAALVIPDEGEHESIASDILKNHRQRPIALVGLGLVAIAGIALLSHISWHFHSGTFWLVLLIIGASLLWAQRGSRAGSVPALPPAPGPSEQTTAAYATATPVTRRRRSWRWLKVTIASFTALFVIAFAAVAAIVAPHLHLGDGTGNRFYQPATTATLRHSYRLGIGHLKLDLSQLKLSPTGGPTRVDARLGTGHLEIIVPAGVTVLSHSRVVWGDSRMLGQEEDGHNVDDTVGKAGARLILTAHVGIGDLEVRRASS